MIYPEKRCVSFLGQDIPAVLMARLTSFHSGKHVMPSALGLQAALQNQRLRQNGQHPKY